MREGVRGRARGVGGRDGQITDDSVMTSSVNEIHGKILCDDNAES